MVVVLAVAERDDQILCGDSAGLGMEQRPRDARIVRVVIDGEHAVSVQVVAVVRLQDIRANGRHRRAVGLFGSGSSPQLR